MRLTALHAFKYAGKWIKPGQTFEAEGRYGRTLIALRNAKKAEGGAEAEPAKRKAEPKPEPVYFTDIDRPPPGETPRAPKKAEPKAEPKKGSYGTRRMKAKD